MEKICKICNTNNKISKNRLVCNYCRLIKYPINKNYFKSYYAENKSKLIQNQLNLYHTKYKTSLIL